METGEDNVYEETTQAEKEVKMEANAEEKGVSQEVSTVLGKFKDVDALARAYGQLEAEFTRRSQRLKKLEKDVENFQTKSASGLEAEKLRKTAKARKAETKKFDEFLLEVEESGLGNKGNEEENPTVNQDTPNASVEVVPSIEKGEETTVEAEKATTQAEERTEKTEIVADTKIEASIANQKNMTEVLSSDALYEKVCQDEQVRLRIIGEYLTSIGKTGAPLTTGGVGMITPPMRAKTIGDAGNMALRFFQKEKKDN